MFTGLVEGARPLVALRRRGSSAEAVVDLGPLARDLRPGDSVSIAGTCLTVEAKRRGRVRFRLSEPTLRRTALRGLAPGAKVNVERPTRLGGRLGGHLVAGHVDGVGLVRAFERDGDGGRLVVRVPSALRRYLVPRGSIAVDGVSLTLASVRGTTFEVYLVPETLRRTTLGRLRPGDPVNLEADLVGKWVEALLRPSRKRPRRRTTGSATAAVRANRRLRRSARRGGSRSATP